MEPILLSYRPECLRALTDTFLPDGISTRRSWPRAKSSVPDPTPCYIMVAFGTVGGIRGGSNSNGLIYHPSKEETLQWLGHCSTAWARPCDAGLRMSKLSCRSSLSFGISRLVTGGIGDMILTKGIRRQSTQNFSQTRLTGASASCRSLTFAWYLSASSHGPTRSRSMFVYLFYIHNAEQGL